MNKDELTALIADMVEKALSEKKPQTAKRAYAKRDEKVEALLAQIVETDVAYKEAIQTRKDAEARAIMLRDKLANLIVESRRLKITQVMLAEALGVSGGSMSNRVKNAKKRARRVKTTK